MFKNRNESRTSACAVVTRPDQTCPYADAHFVIGEVVLPSFPYESHIEPEIVSRGRVAAAVKHHLEELRIMESQIEMAMISHEASAAYLKCWLEVLKSDPRMIMTAASAAQRARAETV